MSSDIAIKVENLSKCYQIYEQPRDRLKQFVMPRLQRGLGKQPKQYYREFWALKDVSFEVKKGETVGIIGRNGSGKSTLLQIICGTLNPTGGAVITHGRIAALLELGSGFNPDFTGRENVYMNASVLGLSNDEIDQRFDAIAAFADIGEFIEQPVKNYSSGMMVRLAFAVIAHVDADILVIDEALAVGDAIFSQKCFRFINEFKKIKAILFVSHDAGAVANVATNAIWIESGRIVEFGSTSKVLDSYHRENLKRINQDVARDSASHIEAPKPDHASQKHIFVNQINSKSSHGGSGRAVILKAGVFDLNTSLPVVTLQNKVTIKICYLIEAIENINGLLVGFSIKDRLGQKIIEENNSSFNNSDNFLRIIAGEIVYAELTYEIPALAHGSYSIDLAVAQGIQEKHVNEIWLYDAIQVTSKPIDHVYGLVSSKSVNFFLEHVHA